MATRASFPVMQSMFDLGSSQSQSNRESWKPILDKFEASLKSVSAEGDGRSMARQQERGQLLGTLSASQPEHQPYEYTARDRISLLLDHESPFLELGSFAGFDNRDSTPCANLIAGIGSVV